MHDNSVLTVQTINNENVVDSRLIALELGVDHNKWINNIVRKYETEITQFGIMPVQQAKPNLSGRPEIFYYLNENQCYFVTTLSRNTERVVKCKAAIVRAFSERSNKYRELESIGLSDINLSLSNDLIRVENGRTITDTLLLAQMFDKQHKNIIREISSKLSQPNLSLENKNFYDDNFIESEYQDSQGRSQKCYLLTQAGFSLIAMGFTGSKAETFKIRYIKAFEEMQDKLRGYAIAHFLGRTEGKQLVYIIKNPITNLLKIGITNNIKRRVSQLQCASGCELEVVYCTPVSDNSKEIEKSLHLRFADFRQYGEWFNLESDMVVNELLKHPLILKSDILKEHLVK